MTPDELKEKLKSIDLPPSFKFSEWEYIDDVKLFLNKHFKTIHYAGENFEKKPAWWRLLRFYELLSMAPLQEVQQEAE